MTKLDILILVVLVASVIWGFRKGIAVQFGALGGLLFGILMCHIAGNYVASWIAGYSSDGTSAHPGYVDVVMANIIVFLVGYLSVRAVAGFFKSTLKSLNLGGFDRVGGTLFCCFEWMLVLSLLFNLWLVIKPSTNFASLSNLGNGHAIQAIVALGPKLLGWAMS